MIENAETLVYLRGQACITPHTWLSSHGIAGEPRRAHLRPRPIRQRAGCDARRGADVAGAAPCRRPSRIPKSTAHVAFTSSPRSTGAPVRHRDPRLRPLGGRARDRAATPSGSRSGRARRTAAGALPRPRPLNAYAQTAVAPYAVRALAEAPVATPLEWGELARAHPRRFQIHNIFRRMARRRDPWSGFREAAGVGRAGPREAREATLAVAGARPGGSAATAARRRRSPRPARSPRTGGR